MKNENEKKKSNIFDAFCEWQLCQFIINLFLTQII